MMSSVEPEVRRQVTGGRSAGAAPFPYLSLPLLITNFSSLINNSVFRQVLP
jgi:hypothetical protein